MDARDREEKAEIERSLSVSPPFSTLPAAERAAIAMTLRLTRFAPGQTVFSEGQAAEESWLVHAGSVRILSYWGESRMMQLERLGRGQLFGLYCRIGARLRTHQCTAVADEELSAIRVSDELWNRLSERQPSFARAACAACANRLLLMRRLVSAGRDTVDVRLARVLWRLYRVQGPRVAATRHFLAVQAGTAIETVFRALARLRRGGVIATERSAVVIKNPRALAALAQRRAPAGRRSR